MSQRLWSAMWGERTPLVGMVHLLPLPGSPGWAGSMEAVLDAAVRDARTLEEAGFDAMVVENYGDVPFFGDAVPAVTVASMTSAVLAVRQAVALPVGVNVLRNDAAAGLGIAVATGARFMRINVHTGSMWTDQGMLEGRAAHTLRQRAALGADVAILADVHVKHAAPPMGIDLETAAADTWHRGLADALVVTGTGTGRPSRPEDVAALRQAVPDAPVLVGSGARAETIRDIMDAADGVIVGSAVMTDGVAGRGVDAGRAERLIRTARKR